MKNALALVGRYGPLVAAILVGLGGLVAAVFPQAKPLLDAFVTVLGYVGAQPDADVVAAVSSLVASALLVYGGVRKTINIVREKFGSK